MVGSIGNRLPQAAAQVTKERFLTSMAKLVLINPPLSRYDSRELAPPLGLLILASQARARGLEATILDLNLPEYRDLGDNPDRFYKDVLQHASFQGATEVGITSMGVNSHVALSLAALIDDELRIPVHVGGPHLSSIGAVAKRLAPYARVWDGEARTRLSNRDWQHADSPGLTWAGIHELFSGFDLSPYFRANSRRVANLEAGRGCRYNCAFCYSPATHDRWITVNPDLVHEAFSALKELGFAHVFLVDDNLTNDSSWLSDLSVVFRKSPTLSWNGYATVRDLRPEMMERLVSAGCSNLYLGVDAVAPTLQKAWRKRFFTSLNEVIQLVATASTEGMSITAALILTPAGGDAPENTTAIDAALKLRQAGAEIRLSILTPYPGTAVQAGSLSYSEARPAVLMDLPRVVVENPFARLYPASFPWHAAPSDGTGWEETVLAVSALQTALMEDDLERLPKTATAAWHSAVRAARLVALEPAIHKVDLRGRLREGLQAALEVW